VLINNLKKIVTNTFPTKYKDIIDPLAFVLNPFIDSLTNALNRRLSFNDNFNASDMDLEVKLPINNLNLLHSVKGKVTGLIITRVLNLDNNAAVLTQAPFIEFTQINDNTIQITNIIGLTVGIRYKLRILLYGN